jgi:hypothetical protein
MNLKDIQRSIADLIIEAERAGYDRGIREGAARLETIASIVPGSMAKADILKMAEQAALSLKRKLPKATEH